MHCITNQPTYKIELAELFEESCNHTLGPTDSATVQSALRFEAAFLANEDSDSRGPADLIKLADVLEHFEDIILGPTGSAAAAHALRFQAAAMAAMPLDAA